MQKNNSVVSHRSCKTISRCAIGCFLSLSFFSNTTQAHAVYTNQAHLWSVTASIGYTDFQDAYKTEGQTILGRLAFDRLLIEKKGLKLGVELGVQNGNDMRLDVSQEDLDILGGSPVQTTVKPTLDLLATLATPPLKTQKLPSWAKIPVFLQVKGGAAYRNWQFNDRTSVNFLSNIAGEVQAGIGFVINNTTNISVLYQGIYGGSPEFVVNETNETAHINTIPIQNGVLLSLSYVV